MFIGGLILFLIPKDSSTGNIGIKVPYALKSEKNLRKANKTFGKLLLFAGPLSAITCFLISVSPLNNYIPNNRFYESFNLLIIIILIILTQIILNKNNKKL